jgi:hypothetical protein
LVIGFLLVVIMLAGEKGIWGSLEPALKKALARVSARRAVLADSEVESR